MRKIYSWEDWFSRSAFVLRKGKDYLCSHSSMSQQIRNAASLRGLRVNIVENKGELAVTVEPKLADEPKTTDKVAEQAHLFAEYH